MNRLDEYRLERFLFGAERVALAQVRGPILELQEGAAFIARIASLAAPARRPTSITSSPGRGIPTTIDGELIVSPLANKRILE